MDDTFTTTTDEPGGDPAYPAPAAPGNRRRRTVGLVATIVVSLIGVLLGALSLVSAGKVAFRPGTAAPVIDRLEVDGAPTYAPDGDILFLTVAVDRLSVLEWLFVRRDKNAVIVDTEVAFPRGRQAERQENAARMARAKSDAELVALQRLGYEAYKLTGAFVESVEGPSTGVLRPGDTIVDIDGTPITTVAALTQRLRATVPGAVVTLKVEAADAATRTERVTLGVRPDGQPHGFLGVTLKDRVSETNPAPVAIDIDSGRIGGDSAGLAFTLSILDDLTPGELTGGKRVAVTGTIDIKGDVGAIGGAAQKVAAARKAKADIVLVPEANFDEANASAAGRIRVVAVRTLDQALEVLAGLGGNANDLPKATAG